jgi:hypothetical protein
MPLERLAEWLTACGCCSSCLRRDALGWLRIAGVHVNAVPAARLLQLGVELAALLPERPIAREKPKTPPKAETRIDWAPARRARHSTRLKAAAAKRRAVEEQKSDHKVAS